MEIRSFLHLFFVILPCLFGQYLTGQVSSDEAVALAQNFFIRQSKVLDLKKSNLTATPTLLHTRTGQPFVYVINFSEGGFVITSAAKHFYPVPAWSPTGFFSMETIPDNCLTWLQWYEDQMEKGYENPLLRFDGMEAVWDRYLQLEKEVSGVAETKGVEPLLTVKWDQGRFYNTMCPVDVNGISGHAPVGCVATAMAMVMYYYRYPEQGNGFHSYTPPYNGGIYGVQAVDFGNTFYRWDEMPDQCFTYNDAVAELSYHCGVAVNMKYTPTASGAATLDVPFALIYHFRYMATAELLNRNSFETYEEWRQLLTGEIDNNRPVIYRSVNNLTGHAYVCDGYHDSVYFHFNWGWSGNHNGYYYINELIPGGLDLSYGQGGVFFIYPDTIAFDYPPFCQGEKLLTTGIGSVTDGSGPMNYQYNAWCSWLIKPDDPAITNIMMDFSLFDLSENDLLHVYAGENSQSPLIGIFSGNVNPPVINTTQPTLYLVFESNDAITGRGFHANYHTYGLPFCQELTMITAPEGYLNDGSDFFDYANNQDCRWLLAPVTPVWDSVDKIRIQFTRFDLAAGDTLFVYDGEDETSPTLAKLSGSTQPPEIVSSSNRLLLNFRTNESDSAGGWEIRHRPVAPVYCTDTTFITAWHGVIEDGSGDKHYNPNTNCHWLVNIPDAEDIVLEFTKLDTETNYDYILIRNLNAPNSPPERITGNIIPPPITINSDKVLISFYTDHRDNYFGWEMNYYTSAEQISPIDKPSFNTFPNPVGDLLIIRNNSGKPGLLTYTLFDLPGNEMRSGRSEKPETIVDTRMLPAGIYLIEIRSDDHILLQKIIKL
jgi:hypothetical protein